MYNPRSFKVEDPRVLSDLIRANNFGTLFSQTGPNPFATHLPFMLDPERGEHGTLVAHMARANPHWRSWTDETRVLCVFQGPHTYISPGWYERGEAVPTWNYAVVHALGRPCLVEEPEALRAMVERLVDQHEVGLGSGWDPALMQAGMAAQLEAIVGFEIPIETLEGKFKFNQNRSRADQESVVRALQGSPEPAQRAVAEIMRRNLEGRA